MSDRSVSVAICTRNRAGLLPELVRSLRAQAYDGKLEIVVIDNGSTDGTRQVIESLIESSGPTLRYFFELLTQITVARNRALKEARFDYVAFIDDDCLPEPSWLQELMSSFDFDKDAAVVGGQVNVNWQGLGRPDWLSPRLESSLVSNTGLGTKRRLLLDTEQVIENNMALERKTSILVGGFLGMEQFGSRNMSSGEVLYLLYQLRHRGKVVVFVPEAKVDHVTKRPTARRILVRFFWQGVSDVLLEYLTKKPTGLKRAFLGPLNMTVAAAHILMAGLYHLRRQKIEAMTSLIRAFSRTGSALTYLKILGDWKKLNTYLEGQSRQADSKEVVN